MTITHGPWLHARTPTFEGAAGKAWRITDWTPQTPDQTATVGGFLVFAPHAHPFWAYWVASVVHLRPIEGVKPAFRRHDDHSHEFMVLALNPDHAPPDPKGWGPFHYLKPIDVVEQFQVPSDEAASTLLDLAMQAIVHGHLSPDQDFRTAWKQAIAETAAHARGEHAG